MELNFHPDCKVLHTTTCLHFNKLKIVHFAEYERKNKLRFVRIYFDTPTFDRITKDRAAKFVDILSAIGGTMGLLTGFSIISAVEFVYFVMKSALNYFL